MNHHPTRAEALVLDLVAQGKVNKEIARALHIEVSTVKRHLYNVYPKMGVRNRTQAALVWRTRMDSEEVAS